MVIDAGFAIRYVSDSVERMIGHSGADLTGRGIADILHPDDVGKAHALLSSLTGTDRHHASAEWRLRCSDGSVRYAEAIANSRLDDPRLNGFVLNLHQVTERKILEEELRHRAFHDTLTNLPNRSLFEDRVEHALERASRDEGQVAVLFLDLDEFKAVNDSLGHAAGDLVLAEVARRLRGTVRTADTAARLGGDEFAVLLEGLADEGEAISAAERILAALHEPFQLPDTEVLMRASLGIRIADAQEDGESSDTSTQPRVQELLRDADAAMYGAKRRGTGGYELFTSAMKTGAFERLGLQG